MAIASSDEPLYVDFSRNVRDHKRVFVHPNFGKHLNCCKSLSAAYASELIKAPFTLIHPDMVLVEPIKPEQDFNIIFSQGMDDPSINERIELDIQEAVAAFDLPRENAPATLPIGDIIVFNQSDIGDVNQIQFRTEYLIEKYGDDWNVSKAGTILAFYDLLSRRYRYKIDFLEGTLLHDALANFIHYKHGMPPVFSKLHYKYNSPNFMTEGAFPMQPLFKHNPTVSTNYVQSIVRSYLGY